MNFNKAILVSILICSLEVNAMESIKALKYWFWWPIRTYDTFEADTPPVMQLARNIYATLVSDYIDGVPQGILAKDWEISPDGKVWRFHLRSDLKFDDGSPITPEIILLNFKRILWLTKEEGLVLNSLLPEVKAWTSMHTPSKSIYIERGGVLVFHFDRRPIGLFEAIGQPIYGVAHPSSFDKDGKWLNPLHTIASGQYAIKKRGENYIELVNRGVFSAVSDAPRTASIHWPLKSGESVVSALEKGLGDLTVEHSFALGKATLENLKTKGIQIVKEPPVRMHFVHLNHHRLPFKSKELRQAVRDRFLLKLSQNKSFLSSGGEVDASFIPKGGVGFKVFPIGNRVDKSINWNFQSLKTQDNKVEVLLYPFSADPLIQNSVESSLLDTLSDLKLEANITRYTERFEAFNRMRKGDFDVIVRGTGVLVHNPYGDLRMMFMSTVGAKIPDPTAKIPSLIEKAENEADSAVRVRYVEQINQSLFDEAAIITFAHSGLLYLHKGSVDFKHYNLFADPIEFRAIGWKPRE